MKSLVEIWIERFRDTGYQNLGNCAVVVDGREMFKCVTLELSWILNQPSISCIQTGSHSAEIVQSSPSFNYPHLHIKNVKGRTGIKAHVLNYFKELKGCVGFGESFTHLNNDNEYDITRSTKTLEKILSLIPEGAEIKFVIKDHSKKQVLYHV